MWTEEVVLEDEALGERAHSGRGRGAFLLVYFLNIFSAQTATFLMTAVPKRQLSPKWTVTVLQ